MTPQSIRLDYHLRQLEAQRAARAAAARAVDQLWRSLGWIALACAGGFGLGWFVVELAVRLAAFGVQHG